jgi:hypothetical protein
VAALAVVALVAVLLTTSGGAHAAHPEPRPGVTAEAVLPPGDVPRTPGALEAYAAARAVPQVLDGTYCHCDCAQHAGHRSLLTCFESEHGAYCDICIGEAILAERMSRAGRSLEEIRQAVDRQFGG